MKKYTWNAKKCFGNLLTLANVIMIAWFVISWLQIVIFNTSADPYSHYSTWNAWILMAKIF